MEVLSSPAAAREAAARHTLGGPSELDAVEDREREAALARLRMEFTRQTSASRVLAAEREAEGAQRSGSRSRSRSRSRSSSRAHSRSSSRSRRTMSSMERHVARMKGLNKQQRRQQPRRGRSTAATPSSSSSSASAASSRGGTLRRERQRERRDEDRQPRSSRRSRTPARSYRASSHSVPASEEYEGLSEAEIQARRDARNAELREQQLIMQKLREAQEAARALRAGGN